MMILKKLFSGKGLKLTPQRLAIYDTLLKLDHPYVEEIVSHVRASNPTISIATVYNILDVFERNKIITRLASISGKTRYDAVMMKHYHVYDAENDFLRNIEDTYLTDFIENYVKEKSIDNPSIKNIQLFVVQ